MRTREQERGARAFEAMGTADEKTVGLAIRLPALLQVNGLLATWAFLLSKGAREHRECLGFLVHHLRQEFPSLTPAGDAETVFLRWVGARTGAAAPPAAAEPLTGPALRQLTAEALAFAGWLKRAAEVQGGEVE